MRALIAVTLMVIGSSHVGTAAGAKIGFGGAGGGRGAAGGTKGSTKGGAGGGGAGGNGGVAGVVVDCPPPQSSGPRYVDHTRGTDNEGHGTGTGACAYRTLTYALKKAPGPILLSAADVYRGGVAGEKLPFLLQKQQSLTCNGATLANASDQGTYEGIVQLAGASNQLTGCNFDGGTYGGYCALVNAAGSSGATPHAIIGCTFTGCGHVSLEVAGGSNHVRIDGNAFTLDGNGIEVRGTVEDVTLTNNAFTGNLQDVVCELPATGVTGSGNLRGGGTIACSVCGACPF